MQESAPEDHDRLDDPPGAMVVGFAERVVSLVPESSQMVPFQMVPEAQLEKTLLVARGTSLL
ncbi:MAG: hypothetical protein WD963_00765 [Candidatus Paceibacterota bacterium]